MKNTSGSARVFVRYSFAVVSVLVGCSAFATDVYISQSGGGSGCTVGTCASHPYAMSDLGGTLTWASLQNDRLCLVGTITSAISIGSHSSSTQFILDGSCDSANQGNILVTGSSPAVTVPGGSGRYHTTIQNVTVRSTAGPGIKLQGTDSGGISDLSILNVVADNNGAAGLNLKCDDDATYSSVTIEDSSFDNNVTQGSACLADTSGKFVYFTDWTLNNTHWNDNGSEGVRWYSATSPSLNTAATARIRINGFTGRDLEASNNGLIGFRIGNGTHYHNNGKANWDGITANYNGQDGDGHAGGGILWDSFGSSGVAGCDGNYNTTGCGASGAAGTYSEFGGAAGNDCYLGHVELIGNRGQNSGIDAFALNGCVIEHVTVVDTYVPNGTGCPSACSVIDGDGIILDEETDNTLAQFIESSGNLGNNADNSGAGIMVLRQTDNVKVRYSFGTGNKTGLWITGSDINNVQAHNLTFTASNDAGIRHTSTLTNPSEIHIKDSIFTGDGSGTGHSNDAASAVDADYNILYNFSTARSLVQTAGAHDSTSDPRLVDESTDLRMRSASSPAYNAAVSMSYTNVDVGGVTVPQNGSPDIGAYEYNSYVYPTVKDFRTSSNSSGTSWTVNMPTTDCTAGDLILVVTSSAGATSVTQPAGWTELYETSNGVTQSASWHKYTGTEGSTVTFTLGSSGAGMAYSLCITGAADPAVTAPEVGTSATGVSASPNPPSVSPSWGSDHNLYIAAIAYDEDGVTDSVTAYPTSYSGNQHNHEAPSSTRAIAIATRELQASSDDPGAYTISISDNWVAQTIAVRPKQ